MDNGHHQIEYTDLNEYIIGIRRWKISLIIAKACQETGCGTDCELLMCKFQIKLKWEKTAKQLPWYDLEHMPSIFKKNP